MIFVQTFIIRWNIYNWWKKDDKILTVSHTYVNKQKTKEQKTLKILICNFLTKTRKLTDAKNQRNIYIKIIRHATLKQKRYIYRKIKTKKNQAITMQEDE